MNDISYDVRCNNCYEEFFEEDLELFFDEPEGNQKFGEWFKGCPNCKTDEYLTDLT
jgi:hypothetical protein